MLKYFRGKNLIFLILVIFLLLMIPKITGIIMLFFAAYVIACALNPFVVKLQKKFSRSAASAIAVLTSTLAVFALFVPIVMIAYKEIGAFIIGLPERIVAIITNLSNDIFRQGYERIS